MSPLVLFALLAPWLLVAFLCWVVYQLLRQHGRSLVQLDELGGRLAAVERVLQSLGGQVADPLGPGQATAPARDRLALGSPAPEFGLVDLEGHARTLQDFRGRPLLLIFFSTDCGFCVQMAPRLGRLPADAPRVALIGSGDRAEYRRMAKEHAWRCDVLLDPAGAGLRDYRVTGTPMAYLLDEHGRVASDLAVGADQVLALLSAVPTTGNGMAAAEPRDGHASVLMSSSSLREKEQAAAERARAAGLAVRESTLNRQGLAAGTTAPDFSLPDLAGDVHSLGSFRGRLVLLVFSDPNCGPCEALAPRLVELQNQRRDELQVVMVSRGELSDNRAKARQHKLNFPVVLQSGWQVSKDYGIFATPVGYLIGEDGVIVEDVAVGGDAILGLGESLAVLALVTDQRARR